MPEPTPQLSTTELARYEMCSLAWWYDRTHPLAEASTGEINRKLSIFTAVYGPGATELPEYRLLTDLKQHHERTSSIFPIPAPEMVAPSDSPQRLFGCVGIIIFGIIAVVIISIFLVVHS